MSNLNLNTISSLDTGREVDVNRVMQTVDYVGGLVIDSRDTVIVDGDDRYVLTTSTTLPYTTIGAGMPEGGAFVNVGDAVLRQDLASPDKGATMVWMTQIPNGEGRSVAQKLSDIALVTPYDVGAPSDGNANATPFLQKAIDGLPDGGKLDLMGGTYRIQKGAAHPAYPNSDQPCLVVYGKKNVTIKNGTLLVKEHGLGAMDFNLCENAKAENLICVGAGSFPPIDGTTGRAEKGDWLSREGDFTTKPHSDFEGYFDRSLHWLAARRNNSVDSSTYSTGGFGGNFPQWGGGTASTWGVWNGGFIGNYGFGISFIDCTNSIADSCNVSLFNGSGIYTKGGVSTHIKNCHIHGNYIGGVEVFASSPTQADHVTVSNNTIENNGHPQASTLHDHIDPGYGFAINNGTKPPRQAEVKGNIFRGNKRKGVDAHSFDNLLVEGNVISSTGFGIQAATSDSTILGRSAIITGNTIHNIDYSASSSGEGISIHASEADAIISQNRLTDIGSPETLVKEVYSYGISIGRANTAVIEGNTIENSAGIRGGVAISVGKSDSVVVKSSTISSNIIKGCFQFGILGASNSSSASYTDGNLINLENIAGILQAGSSGHYSSTGRNLINIPRDGTNNKFALINPAYRLQLDVKFPELTVTNVRISGVHLSQPIECTASAIPQGFKLHIDPRLMVGNRGLHVGFISPRVKTGVAEDPIVDSITHMGENHGNSEIWIRMISANTGINYPGSEVTGTIRISMDV